MATIHELIVSARSTGIPEVQAQINTLYRAGRTDIQGLTADAQRFGHHSLEAFQIFKGLAIYRGFGYITQSLGEGVNTAMEFEHSLAKINSLLQVSDATMQNYGNLMADLGQRIPIALNDMAGGMYDIVSAGYEQEAEITRVLELSGRAAVAGGANIRTTIQAGIGAMNAFGRTTAELSHIFDVQFQTVKYGIFEYDQLNQAFGRVAAAGSLAGQQLESVSGALVAISRGGFGGPAFEEGATRVVNFFQELSRPKAQQDIEAMGVAVFDSYGKMRDAMDIVADMNEKLALMTQEQQQASINQIFTNIRSAQGFEVLSKQLGIWREATLQNIFAAGATEDAFEKMSNTAQATITKIQNQFTYGMTGLVSNLKAPLEWIGTIVNTIGQNIAPVIIMLGALASKYVETAIRDQMKQRSDERLATQAQQKIYLYEMEANKMKERSALMEFESVMTRELSEATQASTQAVMGKMNAEELANLRIKEKLLSGQLQSAMTEQIAVSETSLATAEQVAAAAAEIESLKLKESAQTKAYSIALNKEYDGVLGVHLINLYDERNTIDEVSRKTLEQNSIIVQQLVKKREAISATQEEVLALENSIRVRAESKAMTVEEMLARMATKEALDSETNSIMQNNMAKLQHAQSLQTQYRQVVQQLTALEQSSKESIANSSATQTLTAATQASAAAFEAKDVAIVHDTAATEQNTAALTQQVLASQQVAQAGASAEVMLAARTAAVQAAAQSQTAATTGLTNAEARKAAAVMASLQSTIQAYDAEEAAQLSRTSAHLMASQSISDAAMAEAMNLKAATDIEMSSAGYIKQAQLSRVSNAELTAAGIVQAFREEMLATMENTELQGLAAEDYKAFLAAKEAAVITASQANLGLAGTEARLGAAIMASLQAAITSTDMDAQSQQMRATIHIKAAEEIILAKRREIAAAIENAEQKVILAETERNAIQNTTMAVQKSVADIELAEAAKIAAIEAAANANLGLRGNEAKMGSQIMASLQDTIAAYEQESAAQENRSIVHANAARQIALSAIDEAQAIVNASQTEIAAQEKIIAAQTQRLAPTTQTMGAVNASFEKTNALNAETQAIIDNQMAERGGINIQAASTVATQQTAEAVLSKTMVLDADTRAQELNASTSASNAVYQEVAANSVIASQAAMQAAISKTSGSMLMNNQISAARAAVINQTTFAQREQMGVLLQTLGIEQDSAQARLLDIAIRWRSRQAITDEERAILRENNALAENLVLKYNQVRAAQGMALGNEQLANKMAAQNTQLAMQSKLYWMNAAGMIAMVASFGAMATGSKEATSILMGFSTALMLLQTIYPIVNAYMVHKTAVTVADTAANMANAVSLVAVGTGLATATAGATAPTSVAGALTVSLALAAAIGGATGALMYFGNTIDATTPKFDEYGNAVSSMQESQDAATKSVDNLIATLVSQGETFDTITPKVADFVKTLNETGTPGFAVGLGQKGFGVYNGQGLLAPKMLPVSQETSQGMTAGQWAARAGLEIPEISALAKGGEEAIGPFLKLQEILAAAAQSSNEWEREQARLFATNIFGSEYGQSLMTLWSKYNGKFQIMDPANKKEVEDYIETLKGSFKVKYYIEADSQSLEDTKKWIAENMPKLQVPGGVGNIGNAVFGAMQPGMIAGQLKNMPEEDIKQLYADMKANSDEGYKAIQQVVNGWLQLSTDAKAAMTLTTTEMVEAIKEGVKNWTDSLSGAMKFGDVVKALTDAGAQLDAAGIYWQGTAGNWNDLGKEWAKIQRMWSALQIMQTLMSVADSLASIPTTVTTYTTESHKVYTQAALQAQQQIKSSGQDVQMMFNLWKKMPEQMRDQLFPMWHDLFEKAMEQTTVTTQIPHTTPTGNDDYSGLRDQIYQTLGPLLSQYGITITQDLAGLLSELIGNQNFEDIFNNIFEPVVEDAKTVAELAQDYMNSLTGAGGIGEAIAEFVKQGASLEDAGFYFGNVAGGWEKLGEEWSKIQNMFKITNFINQITQAVSSMKTWGVDIPESFEETMYNLMQVMAGSVLPNFQSVIDQLTQNLGSADFWQALADGMANAQFTQSNSITLAPYIVIEGTDDAEHITQLVHDVLIEEAKRAGFTWGNG
jgi:hypothetical protein